MIPFALPRTQPDARGDQLVEVVVDGGYRPSSIVARAGEPLRIAFTRRDDDPCMDRIVFSSPHLDRRLARGTTTTVVLPAQPPGEIRFTCGMGRYRGTIQLVATRSSIAGRVGGVLGRAVERARDAFAGRSAGPAR